MTEGRKMMLVTLCCALLLVLPLPATAQDDLIRGTKDVVKEGAQGVKKGGEYVIDKTKEGGKAVGKGAEEVGEETKDLFTDDDDDTEIERMKPSQREVTTPGTTSETPGATSEERDRRSMSSGASRTEEDGLPATAGELPLLVLAGGLAIAGARALKLARQSKTD